MQSLLSIFDWECPPKVAPPNSWWLLRYGCFKFVKFLRIPNFENFLQITENHMESHAYVDSHAFAWQIDEPLFHLGLMPRPHSWHLESTRPPLSTVQFWFAKQYTRQESTSSDLLAAHNPTSGPLTSPSKTISWFLRYSDLIRCEDCHAILRALLFCSWSFIHLSRYLLVTSHQLMAEFHAHWPFGINQSKLR